MAAIPQAVAGAGVAAVGISYSMYSSSGVTPLVIVAGGVGSALLALGLMKKSLPRGRVGCDMKAQTFFDKASATTVKEKSEDGVEVDVFLGPKGIIGLPLEVTKGTPVKDKDGLVISNDSSILTTYDLIFGTTEFDSRPALRDVSSSTPSRMHF